MRAPTWVRPELCEPRTASRTGTPCRCSAPSNASLVEQAQETSAMRWGLPSAGCSFSWIRFWVQEYPRLHAQWRAEGRVAVHCSSATGFGNWVQGLAGALVYSMIMGQALTLRCDDPDVMKRETGHVVRIHESLPHYLRSPHFDWDFDPPRPVPTKSSVDLYATQMNPSAWPWNSSKSTRVVTTHAVHARRVLLFTQSIAPSWRRYFSDTEVSELLRTSDHAIGSCLLRYLLAPTPRLQHAVRAASGVEVRPSGLMPLAAMHVRIGDSSFTSHDSTAKWQFRTEELRGGLGLFKAHPAAPLECLLRLSERADGRCVSCVVLTDSVHVESCAHAALGAHVTTPGASVHFGASSTTKTADPLNQQRVYLDWFLLAHSAASLQMSPGSTFAGTARQYRAASVRAVPAPPPSRARDAIGGEWPHLGVNENFMPFNVSGATEESVSRWWWTQCRSPDHARTHVGM
jgi:hypothetical protein